MLTRDSTDYLLNLVDEGLSDGGRSRRGRQAQAELLQEQADMRRRELKPLLFGIQAREARHLHRWLLGDRNDPVVLEQPPASEINLGLHAMHLAVQSPGERVSLANVDPRVLNDRPEIQGWSRAVSRARCAVRKRIPVLALALSAVTVHGDGTATFDPKPGAPALKTF
jgi:hypothetical protein